MKPFMAFLVVSLINHSTPHDPMCNIEDRSSSIACIAFSSPLVDFSSLVADLPLCSVDSCERPLSLHGNQEEEVLIVHHGVRRRILITG